MSRELYEDITLLLADPENFPEEFDPQRPFDKSLLKKVSRENFVRCVERENGAYVVRREDFDPCLLVKEIPEQVELCDGATYIVIPRRERSYTTRVEGIKAWQKNQTLGDNRMLVARAIKELDLKDTNVRACQVHQWCNKKLTGPNGLFRKVAAVAIADECVIVVEHKNCMDKGGALQLYELVIEIDAFKDSGVGSVADFSGKRIIGALAGPVETGDPNNKRVMDDILHQNGFLKWFEGKDYGDDHCSPFQASGASCDAPNPAVSPGSGPTAPAALPPRRVGRLLAPMRRSAMLVLPRLANTFCPR